MRFSAPHPANNGGSANSNAKNKGRGDGLAEVGRIKGADFYPRSG
jgi:hypothetical protein